MFILLFFFIFLWFLFFFKQKTAYEITVRDWSSDVCSSDLSGAGTHERSLQGLQNVLRRLVRRDARLIQLLDPPFDKSPLNPGYIKGYVPGVRENGGQYTHAAIWTVMAFAEIGDIERAWELFSLINPITHGSTS